MPKKLEWDNAGERTYETGIKEVALFPQTGENGTYGAGVAWNGVTTIAEKPTGAEATALYADDIKYLNLISNEDLEASIEAYTAPDEFKQCDGSTEIAPGVYAGQQTRVAFGLAYKTTLGNDTKGNAYGYKLHLLYGCLAAPSEMSYGTINDSPEAITMSWEIKTTPVAISSNKDAKPTARIVIDSTKVDADKLAALEKVIYGSDEAEAKLLLPDEVIAMFKTDTQNVAG